MKRINFIPDTFVQERDRRVTIIWCGAIFLVGVLLIEVWFVNARQELAELDRELNALKQLQASAQLSSRKAGEFAEQYGPQSPRASVYNKLKMKVPVTSVMALVSELMTPAMGLTGFTLVDEPANPQPLKGPHKQAARPSPKKVAPIRVTLEGLAPENLSIARFVGRLDQEPLFTNVKLVFSQSVKNGEWFAREFQIQADIPLDRPYARSGVIEVSHAD